MDIEDTIERLVVDDEDFHKLEAEFFTFCPFEALGMVRAEVRHGNLLAYLLDPLRPHGFNTQILRSFLRVVARKATIGQHVSALKPLDVHLLDLQDAEVRREWRNIDVLIILHSARLVIPIELKVDSFQSRGQLRRYRKIVEEGWPLDDGWKHISIFLTKQEEHPEDSEHWSSVLLADVADELGTTSTWAGETPAGAALVQSYLRMLRRHHLDDERLNELARKLWARHGEALAFLADNRPDAIGNLFASLRDRRHEIASRMSSSDRNVSSEGAQTSILRFAFQRWDQLRGFRTARWTESKRLILLEVKREGPRLNSYLYLGPGETVDRELYAAALEKHRLHRQYARAGREWMCLAKKELFKAQESDEIDADTVGEVIIKALETFAANVFQHFDPHLRPFDNSMSDDTSMIELRPTAPVR
ncbi:hypothetical protein GR247_13180 [Rhizobium leguminosarum]|nr:hypothetical protein [Rhizobium leguminosarum]